MYKLYINFFLIYIVVKNSFESNGKKSIKFIEEMRVIIKKCCGWALEAVNSRNNVMVCLDILYKCNDILSSGEYGFYPDLVCHLWNNFGCAYRRMGQYNQA